MNDERDIYGLEPSGDERPPAEPESTAPADGPDNDAGAEPADDPAPPEDSWEPILLEGEGVTECPNCGAPMPGADQIVCIRCGFDLTANKAVNIVTGEVEVDPDEPDEDDPDAEAKQKPPYSPAGRGGLQLPAIIAGVCLLIVVAAFFAGAPGLFDSHEGKFLRADWEQFDRDEYRYTLDAPRFGQRITGLFRHLVFVLVVSLSTVGGLAFLGAVENRKVGEANLTMLRALAIISASSIFVLIGLPEGTFFNVLESLVQLVLMGAAFVGLSTLFFKLSVRDAAILGGCAAMILLVLVILAKTISMIL